MGFLRTCGLLLVGLGITVIGSRMPAAEKAERHPHIHKAIHELRESKNDLEHANHDFGGHRKEAVEAIHEAIKQLEQALKFDKDEGEKKPDGQKKTDDLPKKDAKPVNKERHPHIHQALHELHEAKVELENAAHDFGGHRVEALEAIKAAHKQLEQMLKFDKK